MKALSRTDLYIQDGPAAGYVNIPRIIELINLPFIFIIGGRGTGKTFGAIEYAVKEYIPTVFLRNAQVQANKVGSPKLCPFKPVLKYLGVDYKITKIDKDVKGVKLRDDKEELFLCGALSTIHNVRGFDSQETEFLIHDEFIGEMHERGIPSMGEAFANCYETINRNREFIEGTPPLQYLGLSNSNKLANDLFIELNLVLETDALFSSGSNLYYNKKRRVAIVNLEDSPISKRKQETALYKFMHGTDYANMALSNQFRDYKSPRKHYSLKQLYPLINVGEIGIYAVKGTNNMYACSLRHTDAKENYANNEKGITAFYCSPYARGLWALYLDNMFFFETYLVEVLFKNYCIKSRKMVN